jgi:hypothetical protein
MQTLREKMTLREILGQLSIWWSRDDKEPHQGMNYDEAESAIRELFESCIEDTRHRTLEAMRKL